MISNLQKFIEIIDSAWSSWRDHNFKVQRAKSSYSHRVLRVPFAKRPTVTGFRKSALENERHSQSFAAQSSNTSNSHRVSELTFAKRLTVTGFRNSAWENERQSKVFQQFWFWLLGLPRWLIGGLARRTADQAAGVPQNNRINRNNRFRLKLSSKYDF